MNMIPFLWALFFGPLLWAPSLGRFFGAFLFGNRAPVGLYPWKVGKYGVLIKPRDGNYYYDLFPPSFTASGLITNWKHYVSTF